MFFGSTMPPPGGSTIYFKYKPAWQKAPRKTEKVFGVQQQPVGTVDF